MSMNSLNRSSTESYAAFLEAKGSEVYAAVRQGRIGVGIELKPSYYRQAVKNLAALDSDDVEEPSLLAELDEEDE